MEKMSKKSLRAQEGTLKSYFPNSKTIRDGEYSLTWIGKITPTPLSATYTLKIKYIVNKAPKVYVLDPKPLDLATGATELPHVYSSTEQLLCLYYPKDHEWNPGMFYVHSLLPWASEWLLHYEIWVATGSWCGGGVDHGSESDKNSN